MKLINATRCPDELLRPILAAAAREVKARTSRVVVKVTTGRYGSRGMAYNAGWVRWRRGSRREDSCRGAFTVSLATNSIEAMGAATAFYETAAHEWSHIRDYREGWSNWHSRSSDTRRAPHDNRPEERRANSRMTDARDHIERHADIILALAVWIETNRNVEPR